MPRTKTLGVTAGAVFVAVAIGATVVATRGDGSTAKAATTASTTPRVTAKVVRQDLIAATSVAGTLTYGTTHPMKIGSSSSGGSASGSAAGASGSGAQTGAGATATTAATSVASIITGLPTLGTVVSRGQQLFEVNGAPGPALFYGLRPMWRTLQNGVTDGLDVQQLEENLAALGFTNNGNMAVDNHFTLATGNAVAAWQVSRGSAKTGIVLSSDVVYDAGPVRVSDYVAAVGNTMSGTIYNVTGTKRSIQVALDPANQSYVTQGGHVTVTLPDTKVVNGVVSSIGTVATVTSSGGNGGGGATTTATIPVTVTLTSNPKDALDSSPVTVNLVTSRARQVLSVPVNALLALAEGGYALEKVNPDGTTTLVKATPGMFANGFVQITGDVTEGETVVSA